MFEVRQSALTTLMYCFDCRPSCPNTTHYYLELMARKRPHVDTLGKKWEFDPQEPWVFIETMIEKVVEEEEEVTTFRPVLIGIFLRFTPH